VKKKILIFYQSPAEIIDILRLLSMHPFGTSIILVTGGKNLLKIIEKIKLRRKFGVTVYEFSNLNLKNPVNIIITYLRFYYSQTSKIILSIKYKNVFFFNYCWDYVTPFFLDKITAEKITYINFYKRDLTKENKSKKKIIQRFIYKLLYKNSNIKIMYDASWNLINFYPLSKKIYEEKSEGKLANTILKLPLENKLNKIKKIIYFDSNEESDFGNEFVNILSSLFKILESAGYSIIIKKHPVWKLSNCFLGDFKKYKYILDPCPIELYDLKEINYAFGFGSVSLSKIAMDYSNIKVISILKLFLLKKNIKKIASKKFQNHLNTMNNSKNKIYYPDTFEKLEKYFNIKLTNL
jgi:hypothetical protein